MNKTLEEIKQQLAQDNIQYVLAQFVDIHGSAKVKMCPLSFLDKLYTDGAGFAGAAVWGLGQGPNSHDMMARIDLDTYSPLGWSPGVARFATDIFVDGKPHPYCPRTNLRRILNKAEERLGAVFNVGIEPEHFLVTKDEHGEIHPWDPGKIDNLTKPCYDYKGIAPAMGYLKDIMDYCNELGWGVYQADHEDGNGQYEINFDYSDAMTTADRMTFFKMMASQVAAKYGAIATHTAKPFSNRTGSGAHIHYHLADKMSGANLFTDMEDARGFGQSKLAYHFLAGIIKHAPALCAVTSPTINCYKRLLMGPGLQSSRSGFTWTPAFISYGGNNRTQMLRICGPGHIEDRTISAAVNPYLALAAYLAAGMDGIEKELTCPEPNHGNLYLMSKQEIYRKGLTTLPQSMRDALVELETDNVVLDSMGPIQNEFLKLKWQEWNDYHRFVSKWETEHYLTFF